MKKLIFTSVIFLVIVLIAIYGLFYTQQQSSQFLNDFKNIENEINFNNLSYAQQNLKNLKTKYEKNQKNMQMFLNRQNLELISKLIDTLNTNINLKNQHHALLNITKIKTLFQEIKNNSEINLYNVM